MAVKPLKELLKEADSFGRLLGQTKTASAQAAPAVDEVALFAQELIDAESVSPRDEGLEKTALAVNRAEALLQIQTLRKIAQFQDAARKSGFTEEQVNEAVEKIAARKVHENLQILTAVSGVSDPGKDKNSLEKKKVPAHQLGQAPHEKDLTLSLG